VQKITFLGVPELRGPDGTLLHAGTGQPLFQVEHAVGGSAGNLGRHPAPQAAVSSQPASPGTAAIS
jgi:hypothetical protein